MAVSGVSWGIHSDESQKLLLELRELDREKKLDKQFQAVYILPGRRCQEKNGNYKAYSKRQSSQAMPGAIRSVEESGWGAGICHAGQRGPTHKTVWAPRLPMSPGARVWARSLLSMDEEGPGQDRDQDSESDRSSSLSGLYSKRAAAQEACLKDVRNLSPSRRVFSRWEHEVVKWGC